MYMNHELIYVHFFLQNTFQDKHYHILGYVILLMSCRPHTFIWCICESFNQIFNHHCVKMSLFEHPPIKATTNVQFWIISYSTSMYFCLNRFKAYITDLTCNKLIMKIRSFISSYIWHMNIMHWKHIWHMDNCVDEWSMNLLTNECHTNFVSSNKSCVKCAFNAQYQCMKHTNYEWTNDTRFPFLNHEMLSLWCIYKIIFELTMTKFKTKISIV